jgi:hypothetical protein
MAKNNESLNNSLFQLLRSRGYNPTLLGTDGKEIPVPDEAEVFQFHFIKDDKDYGPVTISIDGLNKLVIYYNDAIASSPSEEGHSEDTSWFTLLNHLKRFSQGHQLSFELKNTDHLKYDMAKRNNMKKIDESNLLKNQPPMAKFYVTGDNGKTKLYHCHTTYDARKAFERTHPDVKVTGIRKDGDPKKVEEAKGKSPYGPGGLVRDPPEKEIGVKIGKGGMKQFKVKTPPKKDKVEEQAKWRQGYSASGHPPGFKHKSGEIGPLGGTHTNEPSGYDGDTKKVPVQKHRDKEDELSGRANTKVSTTGKPLLPRNAQKNLKYAIKQSKGKHGPVGALPEGQLDELSPKTLSSYVKKASDSRTKSAGSDAYDIGYSDASDEGRLKSLRHSPDYKKSAAKNVRRGQGINKAVDRLSWEADPTLEGRLAEGYYATGRKSSYSDAVPQVKIILQHSRQLEEGERRYRAIERIFVENAAGERFLLDTKKPGLARVYARHIAEGGTPYDEQGKHIHSLCEEYTQMAGFVRATRNGQFNESTQSLVNEGVNHYNNLRETLHKMAGRRGYNAYFESWTPTLTEDEDSTDLSEMFASTELDPRIESVMPILRKLNKNITEVDHSSELSEWADAIVDESLGLAEVSNELLGRYKKAAGKEASGLDTFANAVAKKGEDPAYKRAADWATKRANKRFSGIVKATNKEFANDLRPKQVAEGDGLESNNPEGIPEATSRTPTQVFPDTKQGAVASLSKNANPRFVKQMDLPNCVVHADPQAEGVWAVDNFKTGVRVIVYLAGYQEPGGNIRGPYDDFEEGQIPKREMMRHQRNDQAQNDVEDDYVSEELGPEQKKVGQAGPTDKAPLRGKLVGACESADKKKPDFAAKFKKNLDKTNKKADDTKEKVKQHTEKKEVKTEGIDHLAHILKLAKG